MLPLISILIPCHNNAQWIGEAIQSAIDQQYPRKEIMVWDDGSTDESLKVIASFGSRITMGSGPNRGGGSARNTLLEMASGTWIQYLDGDDYLKPGKIQAQIDYLSSIAFEADVVYGPITRQFHVGKRIRLDRLPVRFAEDPWSALVSWGLPQTGSPLWRKDALMDVGGWKEDQPVCQEHELYLRLLMAGKKFMYNESGGAVYRRWSENTVCRRDKPSTKRHRVNIMLTAEEFLTGRAMMTELRRQALNRSYLECSRIIWTYDRAWAVALLRHIESQNGGKFVPEQGTVPTAYYWVYRLLGFRAAETVAEWRRAFLGRDHRQPFLEMESNIDRQ